MFLQVKLFIHYTFKTIMILLKPATLLKVTLLHGCFSRFLNCTNGTKSRKASQISYDKKKFSGAGNL